MERRNRSLEALKELRYVDSLDDDLRAHSLDLWYKKYLTGHSIEDFDLELPELKELSELFYKNILFLKQHTNTIQSLIKDQTKIKEFLK